MTSARDSTSRLRQTLNPLLTTSLGGFHGQLNTPHSAISVSSPYTYSAAQTPSSSIQPYNPQQWAPSPAVERTHQFTPPASHEPQSSPLPPPPYSPPRSQGPVSGAFETPPANTSAARIPPTVHRPSPEPQCAQNFPPPPGAGGRGASRERRFGLPSLSRRRDRDAAESSSPPDIHPSTSISRPQPLTIQVPQLSERVESTPSIAPPAARRAASASAIETPTSARSRSSSQSRWAPGMPLPPPPPGPPPSNSRSQSLNRTIDPNPVLSPPTRRPPPNGVTALGPVPPTPADWVDDERQQANRSAQAGLSIDTASASSVSSQPPESATSGSSSAGGQLARAGAVRGEKSLRERRTESRTRHSRGESSSNIPPLTDILVPQGAANLSRRFSVHKGTPRSGGRSAQDTPWSGDLNTDSRNSTPRVESAGIQHPETPTPPFSPQPRKTYSVGANSQPLAPKALPTPPPQSRSASSSSFTRPEMQSSIGSLIQGPPSTPMTKQSVISQTAEQFCSGTIERFQAFAQKEATAASDADRVKLFADFFVNESRLRRERYNSAIGAMGSEIFDLTRDLFRPMKARRDSESSQASEWTPQVSASIPRSSTGSLFGKETSSQPNSAPASAGVPISPVGAPPNVNWNSNYKPALSPILSMSVSDALDEADSRGRPASRWWEADSVGESSQRLEKHSKRESKYMGVPKEAREALQWRDPPNSAEAYASSSKGYGPDEYPPEKAGWHEPEQSSTPQPFRRSLLSLPASTPNTPSPLHVDVSRLVTLPPPYPRHHPAVNNNHPELTEIRILVRTLSDMKELEQTREHFTEESKNLRDEAAQAAKDRRQTLRMNLQREVSSGNMSYADAAAIEADSAESERSQSKELEKKDFDKFQNAVVMPLNEMLMGRIGQATSLFDELRSRLFVDTHTSDPNMPQEEGDEQPELLEKLTLLKWIFEAREMLHRAIFDLLSDRNDRYKEMVITPYRISGNDEKLHNAEAFFAEDAEKRRLAFANEVLQRTLEFRGVVEENVERGIDMQLNAFWDIAPLLKSLLDKVPQNLRDFRIQIPPHEFEENPSYHQHPMQYLFSLLLHTEKSTYQFIESQTNLLCLLHEVKEAVMGAQAKVSEAEGRDTRSVEEERKGEQERLTDDLKEKVRVVQSQWDEGLGEGIRLVKERVGEWLLSTGGWDETLEDLGVAA